MSGTHDHTALKRYFSFPAIAGQNPQLDMLRSIAILLVLLRHGEKVPLTMWDTPMTGPFHHFMINGWIGVDLFLVLSGYLIGSSLLKMKSKIGPKNQVIQALPYFRARILRIVPAYFAILFLVAAGFFPLFSFPQENLGLRVFYHMLFLQDYLPPDISVVFWSLGVEEKFYILAPLLMLCLLKIKNPKTGLVFLLALFCLSPLFKMMTFLSLPPENYEDFFHRMRRPFHMSLEPLIIGVAIAYWHKLLGRTISVALAKKLMVGVAITLIIWTSSHDFSAAYSLWDVTGQPMIMSLLFGVMVLCGTALKDQPLKAMAFWRPVSRLSYALYLVHFPLIPLCLALSLASPFSQVTFWGYYIVITILAGLILHFAIEKPFLLLKDRKATVPPLNKEGRLDQGLNVTASS